jgi:hypothetical protein
MPTYKVGFPYICVEAPNEKAALAAYDRFLWNGGQPWGPEADVVGDIPDYAVDAEGNQVEELEPAVDQGCTPEEV